MRGSWLVALTLMLAGCSGSSDEGAGDGTGEVQAPDTGMNATASAPAVIHSSMHEGDFTASVWAPTMIGPPVEEQVGDEPIEITLEEEVEGLYVEMVWEGDPPASMRVRAISSGDAYYYGGLGTGTPDDPATLFIEHPENGYSLLPVADSVAAQQHYTFYVTGFDQPVLPEGFTAIPQA